MKKDQLTEEQLNEIPRKVFNAMYLQLSASFDQVIGQNENLLKQNEELIQKVSLLEERIALLTQRMFGRKTEKLSEMDSAQIAFDLSDPGLPILNEAEKLTEAVMPGEPDEETVIIRRKKPKGKRELDLRYVEEVIEPAFEIPEEKLKELFPKGYTRVKDETYSKLEHIPEHFVHHKYTVCVYAGNHGEGIVRRIGRSNCCRTVYLRRACFPGLRTANSRMPCRSIESRRSMPGWE